MFDDGSTADLTANYDEILPDQEFDASGPIQMVVRWNSEDEIDLNAIIFDTNANFMQAVN